MVRAGWRDFFLIPPFVFLGFLIPVFTLYRRKKYFCNGKQKKGLKLAALTVGSWD